MWTSLTENLCLSLCVSWCVRSCVVNVSTKGADGVYRLDADTSRTCWNNAAHIVHCIAAVFAVSMYFIVSLRVLYSGGMLSNVEFRLMRFWRTTEDKFQPRHVHPLSVARVQCVTTHPLCLDDSHLSRNLCVSGL